MKDPRNKNPEKNQILGASPARASVPPPPPPLPLKHTGVMFRQSASGSAEDPFKTIKRELNSLNRILIDRTTLKLSPEDQQKYNPDSGLSRVNGREIELSNLKHIVFWAQGADHLHTISGEQMKKIVQACNVYKQNSDMLEIMIETLSKKMDQKLISTEEAQSDLDEIKSLRDRFLNSHSDLLNTMYDLRENRIASGISKSPPEGEAKYPDLEYLLDNFIADTKLDIQNGRSFIGEDIAQQFFNYLMLSAEYRRSDDLRVLDSDVAAKARRFIIRLGGPEIFRAMSYFGNPKDPKSKYGLVKEKAFKDLLKKAEEEIKAGVDPRHSMKHKKHPR